MNPSVTYSLPFFLRVKRGGNSTKYYRFFLVTTQFYSIFAYSLNLLFLLMKRFKYFYNKYLSGNRLSPIVIIVISFSALFELIETIAIISEADYFGDKGISVVFHFTLMLSFIEVLRRKSMGVLIFFVLVMAQAFYRMIEFNYEAIPAILAACLIMIFYALLLCIRKNGKSAWRCLESGI